jgi:hypothetical protein
MAMKANYLSRTLIPLALLLGFGGASLAQPGPGWTYLGDAHVDGAQDHDKVKGISSKGEFRAIRLKVEDAAIEFERVLVHYHDGEAVPIQIRSRINAGGQTRVIDLPGNRRNIDEIEFWYARANAANPQKPHVVLWGLH